MSLVTSREDVKHALDLNRLVMMAGVMKLDRKEAYRVAEHFVCAVNEEGWRPLRQIVEQDIDSLIVGIDAVEIRIHGNVSRQYVKRRVVDDRVLAQGETDLR